MITYPSGRNHNQYVNVIFVHVITALSSTDNFLSTYTELFETEYEEIDVIHLAKQSKQQLENIFQRDDCKKLDYTPTRLSRTYTCPNGYTSIYHHEVIGKGQKNFEKVKTLIANLDHLGFDWINYYTSPQTLQQEGLVSSQVQVLGLWGVEISKIIDVIDKTTEDIQRFGYIMGTTKYHPLQGEEMFLVEYDKQSEEIIYKIFSYSKIKNIPAKLVPWLVRRKQKQFATDAIAYLEEHIS